LIAESVLSTTSVCVCVYGVMVPDAIFDAIFAGEYICMRAPCRSLRVANNESSEVCGLIKPGRGVKIKGHRK